MEQVALHINDAILHEASLYAKEQGVDLSVVIESFLKRWISKPSLAEKIRKFPISNEVKSLTGKFPISNEVKSLTGHLKVDGSVIDWEKEKENYLTEKYGL